MNWSGRACGSWHLDCRGGVSGSAGFLLLLLMFVLLPAKESQADIACPSGAPISIAYECDTIPEEAPSGAWDVQVRHPASWWSDGEYLHLDAFDPLGEVIFYRVEESLSTAKRYEIEVNVSVSRYLSASDNPTVGIGISDGTRLAKAEAGPDIASGTLEVEGVSEPFIISGIDWSQPVTVRFAIDKTSSDPAAHTAELYVNNALRFAVPYEMLPATDPSVPPLVFAIGGRGTDSVWDFTRYGICAAPSENRPPVAEAGTAIEATVGDIVTLDGTGSHDPDGDALSYSWRQVSGPRASLDDPRSARPRFVVPQSVDLSALVFSLSVSDGHFESEPDSATVLVHASSPDEGTGSLLSEVQGSSLNAARKRRLSRLLQDAMNTSDCSRKLALVEQFAAEVERGRGSWLPAATADAWLERARDLADEIGPCTRSCQEEGGIEGSNLSLEGTIASASGGEAPPPDAPWLSVEYSAQKAIDGEPESVWTAPGAGNELVIDLGGKRRVTGIRVLSPVAQTYRLYAWDNLTLSWRQIAQRTSAVTEGIEDTCDTATQFIRYKNETMADGGDTRLSELEVFGHRGSFATTTWLGTDPALSHQAGHAEGTSWVIGPDDGVGQWMSFGPRARLLAGKRWVQYWLRSGDNPSGEPIAHLVVIRERAGEELVAASETIAGAGLGPRTLTFEAEVGSRYSFAIYYLGRAELALEKIVVRDHPNAYRTEPLTYKVEGTRLVRLSDEEHALAGHDFLFLPGAVPAGTLLTVKLGRTFAPSGMSGSPVTATVNLAASSSVPVALGGPILVRFPLERRELWDAGIRPWDLRAEVMLPGGEIQTIGGNVAYGWPVGGFVPLGPATLGNLPHLEGAGLDFRVVNEWHVFEPDQPTPAPVGFARDYQAYNLFHFAMDDAAGSATAADASGQGHEGVLEGNVRIGAGGKWNRAAVFDGGRIRVEVGRMPRAFAFEAWVNLHSLPPLGTGVIASQQGNFVLYTRRHPSNFIYFDLQVFDQRSGTYRLVATTITNTSFAPIFNPVQNPWVHLVAIFDGHFKGRIYLNGKVNSSDAEIFEWSLNQPITDPNARSFWPREPSSEPTPVILGGSTQSQWNYPLDGALDEVRFSDIERFRVNDGPGCPPRCPVGDMGTGGQYTNYRHGGGMDYYPWVDWMQNGEWPWNSYMAGLGFSHRFPYIQNVTDHSATILWRRQCEWHGGDDVEIQGLRFAPQIKFCLAEATETDFAESNCRMVLPTTVDSFRPQFPECEYQVTLTDLRPSTWYRYRVREVTMTGSAVFPNTFFELASNTHFRTAPLATEDQVEFIAFGDFAPSVSRCISSPCDDNPGHYGGYDYYHLEYEARIADQLRDITRPNTGESPMLWLAVGDLDQTAYGANHWDAYLFGVFNKVKMQEGFRGVLEGIPMYATIGNHDWSGYKDYTFPDHVYTVHYENARPYFSNLVLPTRKFEFNAQFLYDESAYSFDYGNMHIVSFPVSYSQWCFPDNCRTPFYGRTQSDKAEVATKQQGTIECFVPQGIAHNDRHCFLKPYLPGTTPWRESDNPGVEDDWRDDSLAALWLKRDLWNYKDDPAIWKVVFMHVPHYEGWNVPWDWPDETKLLTNYLARFWELSDVDLVLAGSIHVFRSETTYSYSDAFDAVPIPGNPFRELRLQQITRHMTVGTGGYAHLEEDGGNWPYHVGVPRFFVDGNMMFMVFRDLNDGAHHPVVDGPLHSCLMVKGVEFAPIRTGEGIYKSDCQPLDPNNLSGGFGNPADRFPQWECPLDSFIEGSSCLHFDADSTGQLQAVLTGRCVRPHSVSADVLATWGSGLRCIPLPYWLNR